MRSSSPQVNSCNELVAPSRLVSYESHREQFFDSLVAVLRSLFQCSHIHSKCCIPHVTNHMSYYASLVGRHSPVLYTARYRWNTEHDLPISFCGTTLRVFKKLAKWESVMKSACPFPANIIEHTIPTRYTR
ncbi:unnamed protein product [Periconia digitata]|uniref:Uncharacterized protein n=1 Tax=Periconia digitata TaxID=1303443 RepID=A0A9W4UQQ1_9PLEO|nr:unnamed protein product [Periconia digitata]